MRFTLIALALAALTGCESMVAPRYSVSGDNNVALKALGASGIGVGNFTGPERFDNNCRLLGPLEVPDGLSHTQYIRRAFEEELKIAGMYAPSAPRVVLNGRVTHMDFSSTRELTRGTWTIHLTLTSSNGRTMVATESYDFASGFIANTACKQTAEAFAPAVQNLVGKFVRSPEFAALVGGGRLASQPGAPAALTAAQRVDAAFWDSLRASSDPADFRAYLEQFPNGLYAAAARERLAALTAPAAAAAPKASSLVVPLGAPGGAPRPGDTWTYRLKESAREGSRQRQYEVTVSSASKSEIVERYTIDKGGSGVSRHAPGAYLVRLGPSVFSPYLAVFQDLEAQPALGAVEISDPMCGGRVICDAKAKVAGREIVDVPAGKFETIKVTVDQDWRGWREVATAAGSPPGGRQLHIWYAPAVKRAVKFSSRSTGMRDSRQAEFELELESYQLR